MPSLPPRIKGELYYDGVWNDITYGLSQTSSIEITRGTSSEGNQPNPNEGSVLLQNDTGNFSPKNPNSDLFGKIGRNTQMRLKIGAGTPWLDLYGDSNDQSRATSPYNASFSVTGDIDVRIDTSLSDYSGTSATELCGKYYAGSPLNRGWLMFIFANRIYFYWSPDGSTELTSNSGATFGTSHERIAFRVTMDVDNGASGRTITFYTAPTIDGPWTQLGQSVQAGVTSIFENSLSLDIGAVGTLSFADPVGKINAFQLRNGIDGPVVADPGFANVEPGSTSWTGTDGLPWLTQGKAIVDNMHSRLVGEVPAWPPKRTLSGHVTVPIQPAGILRRLGSGSKPLKSAAFRSITFNDPDAPILEYWPWEDGKEADTITSALDGAKNASIKGNIDLAASTAFVSSDALPAMNKAIVTMPIRSYTVTGESQMRFFMNVPDSGIPNDAVLAQMNCTGSARTFKLIHTDSGALRVAMFDAEGAEVDSTGTYTFDIFGKLMRVSIGLTQSGSNVQVTFGTLEPNAPTASVVVETLSSGTVSRVSSIVLGSGPDLTQTVFGHVTFQSAETNLFDIVEQLDAYSGETAGDRIVRLCSEQGVSATFQGSSSGMVRMGPQRIKKFTDLLTEAATSDQGFLLEDRDSVSINYRSLVSMYDQDPAIVLDYTHGIISAPFEPVDDDKLTRNSVIVTVDGGSSSAPQILESGSLSIQDPPFGVGLYDVEYTYSLENLDIAESLAGWLLHTGTFDGLRYTKITLDLANPRVAELADQIMALDVGDKMRLTNLPSDLPPGDVDLIMVGYTETAGPTEWKIAFTCIPGEPYNVGGTQSNTNSEEYATNANNRADLEGSTLHTAMDEDDTNMDVILKSFSMIPWTTAYPVMNGNADMSNGTTGWTTTGGPISSAATPDGAPFDAPLSIKFLPDGVTSVSQVVANSSAGADAEVGLDYYISFWIYSTEDLSDVRAGFNWYDSSDVYFTSSSGPLTTVPAKIWTFVSGTLTAPATTAYGRARVRFGGTAPGTAEVYINQIRSRRTDDSRTPDDFPLDLSVSGEVVRATSCMPGYHDSFYRDTSSGWGTSDSGHGYTNTGGSSSDYSTNQSAQEGRHTLTSTNVSRRSIVSTTDDDCDITAYVGTSALSTGGSQFACLVGRYVDADNLYMARAEFTTTGYVNLAIRKRVGGTETEVASRDLLLPHVAGRGYGVRLYIRGSLLKAQLWDATSPQAIDRAWDIETGDADLLAVGTGFGFRSILATANTNSSPVIAYALPKNDYPQRFIVERSINGVVKSLPSASDVNVNNPLFTTVR